MKNSIKQTDYFNISFIVVMIYLSLLNFIYLKTTPEIIFLQFAVIIMFFKRAQRSLFLKDWLPFIAIFVAYEFIRGIEDNISPFYNTTLYWVYHLEVLIFKGLPTAKLQYDFLDHNLLTNITIFFYTTFFYYSFLTAFIIWIKDRSKFKTYKNQFIFLTYTSLLIFLLVPTAPPWMVANDLGLDLRRIFYDETILNSMTTLTIYNYLVQGNEVAAFPSLHAAWPAFTSLFLIKNYRSKWLYLTLIVPFMIGFSVILMAEHFLLDVILGWMLAAFFTFKPSKR